MIGLPCGEKSYNNILSRFHKIPERNRRKNGRTDRIAISISRVSMLTRDKTMINTHWLFTWIILDKYPLNTTRSTNNLCLVVFYAVSYYMHWYTKLQHVKREIARCLSVRPWRPFVCPSVWHVRVFYWNESSSTWRDQMKKLHWTDSEFDRTYFLFYSALGLLAHYDTNTNSNSKFLTCNQTMMDSQLSLPHGIRN